MGNIKCVIAAGGLGTRLKDYRNSPTKMLLEVNGTPMINRQISQLQEWGLEDFIIITRKTPVVSSYKIASCESITLWFRKLFMS